MVNRQREPQDLGFSSSYEPAARRGPSDVVQQPPRSTSHLSLKPGLVVVGVVLAGVVIFGILKLLSSAGQEVVQHNKDVVGQIDHAKDTDAQMSAQSALIASKVIFTSDLSYAGVNPSSLAQTEPSFRYTTGPSTGSKVVSVSATASEVGIAVSAGKTCWYLADSGDKGATYGSGTGACTGAAALRIATAPNW